MINIPNDIPKYKKKSTASPPAKAKHKHVHEPCLVESPVDWYQKEHERKGETRLSFRSYCPICGKTDSPDYDRWETLVKRNRGVMSYYERVPTEEAERELNPETRTLPVFYSDSPWPKFVEIDRLFDPCKDSVAHIDQLTAASGSDA